MRAMPSTSRWRPPSTAQPSRRLATSSSRAASSRTAIPNTSSPPAAARRKRRAEPGHSNTKSPGSRRGFFAWKLRSPLKHREIFQQRHDADDDDDDARDLLGAAVHRQHVDEIKNEDDDEKGDEYADQHRKAPFRQVANGILTPVARVGSIRATHCNF